MSSFFFPSPSPQPFSSEDLGAARQALGWVFGRGWLQSGRLGRATTSPMAPERGQALGVGLSVPGCRALACLG